MATIAEIRAQFPQYDDLSDAELANAIHKKFYADMPRAEFNKRVGYAPDPAKTAAGPVKQADSFVDDTAPATMGAGAAFLRGATNPFGISDEIGGGIQGAVDWMGLGPDGSAGTFSGGYDRFTKKARALDATAAAEHPIANTGGKLVGGVAAVGGVPSLITAAPGAGTLARIGAGTADAALQGGLYGGVTGFGEGEGGVGNRLAGAGQGAVVGGLVGGAIGLPLSAAGAVIANRAATKAATPPAPDVVGAADRLGITIPRAAASDSSVIQSLGKASESVPLFGGQMKNAASATIAGAGKAADDIAAGYGGGAAVDAAAAGGGARKALENWIGPVTKGVLGDAYKAVDDLIDPSVTTPLNATAKTATDILRRRTAATLKPGEAISLISKAASSPEGLTYEGVKLLRTRIGEMMETGILPADISKAELKQLYGALTEDLRSAVSRSGGKAALKAFDRANFLNAAVAKRREELMRLLGAQNDEGVFSAIYRAAGSTSTADINLLMKARKAMPPEAWDGIASAVVSRMGRANGQGDFSLQRFFTDYGKLSPAGKKLLFAGKGDLAGALDDLATVATRFKRLEQFANPSGTAQHAGLLAAGGGVVTDPISTATAVLGGGLMARVLSRPATVRAMTAWAKVYDLSLRRPSKALGDSVKFAALRFSREVGLEFGLGREVDRIALALSGGSPPPGGGPQPAYAGDQQPPN